MYQQDENRKSKESTDSLIESIISSHSSANQPKGPQNEIINLIIPKQTKNNDELPATSNNEKNTIDKPKPYVMIGNMKLEKPCVIKPHKITQNDKMYVDLFEQKIKEAVMKKDLKLKKPLMFQKKGTIAFDSRRKSNVLDAAIQNKLQDKKIKNIKKRRESIDQKLYELDQLGSMNYIENIIKGQLEQKMKVLTLEEELQHRKKSKEITSLIDIQNLSVFRKQSTLTGHRIKSTLMETLKTSTLDDFQNQTQQDTSNKQEQEDQKQPKDTENTDVIQSEQLMPKRLQMTPFNRRTNLFSPKNGVFYIATEKSDKKAAKVTLPALTQYGGEKNSFQLSPFLNNNKRCIAQNNNFLKVQERHIQQLQNDKYDLRYQVISTDCTQDEFCINFNKSQPSSPCNIISPFSKSIKPKTALKISNLQTNSKTPRVVSNMKSVNNDIQELMTPKAKQQESEPPLQKLFTFSTKGPEGGVAQKVTRKASIKKSFKARQGKKVTIIDVESVD